MWHVLPRSSHEAFALALDIHVTLWAAASASCTCEHVLRVTLFVCLLAYAPDISILQLLALAMAASAGSQFRLHVRNIKYAATKQVSFSCVGIACVV